jgi:phosphonate transport system ATP-binding protein
MTNTTGKGRYGMIVVRNLSKSFPDGGTLFSGIHLDIEEGEFVAVLGASGSGKTVFLRCLGLYEKWSQGKLYYRDMDIFEMGWKGKRLIRKEWALIEEQPRLNPNKSAIKNVLDGSRKHRPWWRLLTGTVPESEYVNGMDYLEKAGLLNKAKAKVGQLSGGEVQRVAIAKALAQGAKVVLADEPVSNLDPHTAEAMIADIRRMCDKHKLTVICTFHKVELAEKYATRLIGLGQKRLLFDVTGRRLTMQEKNAIS